MWPGASVTSADLVLFQNGSFAGTADESDLFSDTSEESYDSASSNGDEVTETNELKTSSKPRKRVTFQPDENLVEIFEIPARGEEVHVDHSSEPIELSPPKDVVMLHLEPDTNLRVSGQATGFAAIKPQVEIYPPSHETQNSEPQKIQRPERPDRPVLRRNNSSNNNSNIKNNANNNSCDAWGTYTVTHAIVPGSGPSTPRVTPNNVTSKPLRTSAGPPSKPKVPPSQYTSTPTRDQQTSRDGQPSPQQKSPVPRRPFRLKSGGRVRKKVAKPKDGASKASQPTDPIVNEDEKLIAQFLQKNCAKDSRGGENEAPPAKSQKSKATKTRVSRKSAAIAKNKEKELINKEMKGEGQKRIYRTPYNNISSLHRSGPRILQRRLNSADSPENKTSSEAPRVKSGTKQPLNAESAKLKNGPKVKVAYGRVRNGQESSSNKSNEKHKSDIENTEKAMQNVNVNTVEMTEKQVPKSNGFIFPDENKFSFPLMSKPKETTSQLVRLDTNLLSMYKKKLYAWHMANGTNAEGRVQTPCISPMWESTKLS